ncbi:MAG TPA: type II secretion system protein [Candidatus Acidoferrales bacterium]|jgi:prepilin-type N-terminal cleavage/methylation domain-containing protein|nr:type II secretion system protein [Candidatus Acidoferrales bacterium]
MRNVIRAFRRGYPWCATRANQAGFTLLEFLIAMTVFLIVTGAVFTLFRRDDPLFNQQENASTLNLSLQNAITQLQLDVVNAGDGYYPGMQLPNWPIGLTIQNSANPPTTGLCGDNATFTYAAACFDTLNVIAMDPNTSPMHTGATGACANTTATSMSLLPPAGNTSAQNTSLAGNFHTGDQVLLVTQSGSVMTTVMLTAAGSFSGGYIVLNFNATNASGQNTAAHDPLGITSNNTGSNDNSHSQLGTSFCNTDWAMRMIPITYKVDDTDPTNPKLDRVQNGNTDILATEIIGFKVGAALWGDGHDTDITNGNNTVTYNYNASTFGLTPPGYDFSIIRSVRVAIIGRTPPNATSAITFRNSYDQGPYQIQGLSIVVNPRNLSMDDP